MQPILFDIYPCESSWDPSNELLDNIRELINQVDETGHKPSVLYLTEEQHKALSTKLTYKRRRLFSKIAYLFGLEVKIPDKHYLCDYEMPAIGSDKGYIFISKRDKKDPKQFFSPSEELISQVSKRLDEQWVNNLK